jgi:hypothetical protein
MESELSGEGQAVKSGNATHGLVNAAALDPAVPQFFSRDETCSNA